MLLPIILSLTAALLFAVASVLQDQGTQEVSGENAVDASFLVSLAKRKVWLAGIAADILGFIFQAWALVVGSLLLVQPLLITTLLFALPLAAYTQHRWLTLREWFWAALLTASLITFMLLGEPSEGIKDPSFKAWIIPLAVLIPLVALFVVRGARLPHGSGRSLMLAIAAGILLGLSAPFTKTGIAAFHESFLHGLTSWEFWAMAVTATLGTLWQQSSYQAGDVQTSLPTVTVLKPVIAMALGLTIYQEHLRVDRLGDITIIIAILLMFTSAVMLGRLATPEEEGATTAGGDSPAPKPAS
ncbi:MAG: DMT family transporter [Gordonia sp. (in: high G+C Gram-positive bacteria)]